MLVHYDWKTGKSRPLTDEIAHRVPPLAAVSAQRCGSAWRRAVSSALTLSQAARPAASGAAPCARACA